MIKKTKKPPKAPKPKTGANESYLIKKEFLTRNYEGFSQWAAGMKILNELFKLAPNLDFWKSWTLEKKFPIFWLYKEDGKGFVLKQYEKWLKEREISKLVLVEKEKIVYDLGNKVGEDYKTSAKPKKLSDFLS